MTPEQEAHIRDCAKTVVERKAVARALELTNAYGKSFEELVKMQQEISVAEALYIEAKYALDAAILGGAAAPDTHKEKP